LLHFRDVRQQIGTILGLPNNGNAGAAVVGAEGAPANLNEQLAQIHVNIAQMQGNIAQMQANIAQILQNQQDAFALEGRVRVATRRNKSTDGPYTPVPAWQGANRGQVPHNPPLTRNQIMRANVHRVNELLNFYGVQIADNVHLSARRERVLDLITEGI
jgi:hypothetical protein